MTHTRFRNVPGAALVLCLLGAAALSGQASALRFKATAAAKGPDGKASAPIEFTIDRLNSDAERDALMGVLKKNDAAATRAALQKMTNIGVVDVRGRKTPIKYAYARSTGGGRLITLLTADPLAYLGAAAPDAKPKSGNEIGLAFLVLDGNDAGDGELSPAATIKMSGDAVVTGDYSPEVVRLTGVARVR